MKKKYDSIHILLLSLNLTRSKRHTVQEMCYLTKHVTSYLKIDAHAGSGSSGSKSKMDADSGGSKRVVHYDWKEIKKRKCFKSFTVKNKILNKINFLNLRLFILFQENSVTYTLSF